MGEKYYLWYLDLISFLVIILIFFFGGAVISSQIILNDELVYVPDITGKTVDEARIELQKRDLGLSIAGHYFSDQAGKGRIISQDPASGSRLKVNRSISVIVSSGQESVIIPELKGKSLEQAVGILRQLGLNRGFLTQIHTPRHPAGRIIAQYPIANTVVEKNSPVGFLVSQGEKETTYLMPDLIGRKVNQVVPRFQASGFKVEDIRHVYYPGLGKGIIVRQNPPGGYPIQKRNPINLEVSR
ncbi:MAG: PASTA domain-containing protein [Acidobacteriota bacterium]|nr:PASTA domain-containing protein [Acidobacteriota bacterium]